MVRLISRFVSLLQDSLDTTEFINPLFASMERLNHSNEENTHV